MGTLQNSNTTIDVSAIGVDLLIGANAQGGQALHGDLGEIVIAKVDTLSMRGPATG